MDIELRKEESDFCKGIALIFIMLSHLPRVMGGGKCIKSARIFWRCSFSFSIWIWPKKII